MIYKNSLLKLVFIISTTEEAYKTGGEEIDWFSLGFFILIAYKPSCVI